MLAKLLKAVKTIQANPSAYLSVPEDWGSLVIDKRQPHTYRAFRQWIDEGDSNRLCLHKFTPCTEEEAFWHPHGWPSAMLVLSGTYRMQVGYSPDRQSKPETVMTTVLSRGSTYEMLNPLAWHAVQPITDCYSIMLNGFPWDNSLKHDQVRTTTGKNLKEMTPEFLREHLDKIRDLIWRI